VRIFHIVARTNGRGGALSTFPLGAAVWSALRRQFPDTFAAVLMPDHLHVIATCVTREDARDRMRALLSGARRHRHGAWLRWEPVPEPSEVPDAKHLRRQIRYVALNPCRSKLAQDPLQWLWSTHRDVVGAAVDPWVTSSGLAAALNEPSACFASRWHAYVSADPSVAVAGTPFPIPALPTPIATVPLNRIFRAAAAAHRVPLERLARRGPARSTFLAMAQSSGWTDSPLLGRMVGASRTTTWRHGHAQQVPAAAWLCLGDARLLESREAGGQRAGGRPLLLAAAVGAE
jgi:REP element-mobilizing transposase RayT